MASNQKPTHSIVSVKVLDEKGDDGFNKTVNTKIGVAWMSKGGAITPKFEFMPTDPKAIIKILPNKKD